MSSPLLHPVLLCAHERHPVGEQTHLLLKRSNPKLLSEQQQPKRHPLLTNLFFEPPHRLQNPNVLKNTPQHKNGRPIKELTELEPRREQTAHAPDVPRNQRKA